MTTVKETNEIFAQKNLHLKLPYPEDWRVKNMEIVEKTIKGDTAHLLLALQLINHEGKEISDIYYGETKTEEKIRYYAKPKPLKVNLMEQREKTDFENEPEAVEYLKQAVIHLLEDKGYKIKQRASATVIDINIDIYGEKDENRIFICLAPRSDDNAYQVAKYMIEVREKEGEEHDYCVVIPAMQGSLGISVSEQERWLSDHIDELYSHKICLFAVNNKNPNSIYPLTTYPREKELMKYFIRSGQQSMFYSQYMKRKSKNSS